MTKIIDFPFLVPKPDGTTHIVGTDATILRALLISIPIVFGVFVGLFCFFAFKLYLEFGWKIYKKIGADPKMRCLILVINSQICTEHTKSSSFF